MEVQAQLDAIEAEIRHGRYRTGEWSRLLAALRMQPRPVRRACSAQVSRISDELHQRTHSRRISFTVGLTLEIVATAVGAALLWHAVSAGSPIEAIVAAIIWIVTLQPLVKLVVGGAFGIRFSYAYLYGVEPRFKMFYGTYLELPRARRILFHLSGMLGSPFGAGLVWLFVRRTMPATAIVCAAAFWLLLIFNLAILGAGMAGARTMLGRVPIRLSSGGVAGQELREALRR